MTDPRDSCPKWFYRCRAKTLASGEVVCHSCEQSRAAEAHQARLEGRIAASGATGATLDAMASIAADAALALALADFCAAHGGPFYADAEQGHRARAAEFERAIWALAPRRDTEETA